MMAASGKRILVLMFGRDAPSTRYRWLDFQSNFEDAGWDITFETLAHFSDLSQLNGFDVVVLQKTMVSTRLLKSIRRYAKKLVYDVDDRIWIRSGKPYSAWMRRKIDRRMRTIASQADVCLAANSFIAKDLKAYGADAEVVPMALDPMAWPCMEREPKDSEVIIGWTGGPKNLSFLESILPAVKEVIDEPTVRLAIHCGEDPHFTDINYDYIPFTFGEESQAVQTFDIGLCPLPDDAFSRGKSPIKSLQYLASGAAVVASPHGAIKDIMITDETVLWADSLEEWQSQLRRLVADVALRKQLARQGRQHLEAEFSVASVFQRLLSHIQ